MRFEVRQRINGTVEEVEKAILDERYLDFLLKHHGVLLEVQLLERKDDGDVVRRKVRYRPKPVIKSVGPKEVPPEWFAFVETSTYDKRRKELQFRNVPTSNKNADMLRVFAHDPAVSADPAEAHRRRYNNNAAAAAAFAAVAGTIASIIIAEQRRKAWERRHRYYYGYYGNPYPPPPPPPYYYYRPY